LFVLNSEFMIRQAKALAARVTARPNETDDTRIRNTFLLVYGRPPSKDELELGLDFLADSSSGGGSVENGDKSDLSKWERYAQVLLSANEFMYAD